MTLQSSVRLLGRSAMVVVAKIASSVSSVAGVAVGTVEAPTLPANGYYLVASYQPQDGRLVKDPTAKLGEASSFRSHRWRWRSPRSP